MLAQHLNRHEPLLRVQDSARFDPAGRRLFAPGASLAAGARFQPGADEIDYPRIAGMMSRP